MYVPVYVCVSAAICVCVCARVHTQAPACARVRACTVGGRGGGYVRACASTHVTFFLSFCHAESVQPRNSS